MCVGPCVHVRVCIYVGDPSTIYFALEMAGEGFVYPALAGGLCRFTLEGSTPPLVVERSLAMISTSLVRCATPAAGVLC